jgi:hypothetical protein
MAPLYALFALVAIPIFFFMLTWVVVTALRICFPEKPIPLDRDIRYRSLLQPRIPAEVLSVGLREIREEQRRYLQEQPGGYVYDEGDSEGLPECWQQDLWMRRN